MEPTADAYKAALLPVKIEDTGLKHYTLPVWTTDDTKCPVLTYERDSTTTTGVGYKLCTGIDTSRNTNGGPLGNLGNGSSLTAC